ncbi:tryptophan halogenase family protein [Sphingomonas nostoxanthinifaciens]|uniref:tryptophan halogenase family protein n=1 Tax=Sphingomonas nostoxanthinifaciens TaxID=2872652 RepID=UPI001CC1E1E4|nr:tryptophan halogenase family protein [Sphingomonas nostoxanthinifaciens]UAK25805.1 tryptophan 7-halogenase [Sphingomonas nostoxanthinifaciens]
MTAKHIVIVGGGTAGWLTAAYLARAIAARPDGWTISLIESADIGTIGVGEGSFPSLRSTLAMLGRSEAEFLRASDATFKQGVRFVDWAGGPTPGAGGADDYFHPFNLPVGGDAPGLLPFWLDSGEDPARPSYADAVTVQERLIRAGRGPKMRRDPDFSGPMNYAYHFDAAKFGAWLRGVATADGVTRIEGTVASVARADDGDVSTLTLADGRVVAGDMFVDCSGFRALLIGETLGAPFHSVEDVLFNDRAIAMQIPYDRPDQPIAPYTCATAHPGGWIWDIGLATRRGTGCVYSSRHMSDDAAEREIRRYGGPQADRLDLRLLKFRTGYRTQQWIGNTVAIGLAAGFFEPLESTGIMLIEVAARMVAEMIGGGIDKDARAAAARTFNRHMAARFAAIAEFLKLHYCISRRVDSAYWRDNRDPATWPEGLRDKLAQWRHRAPSRFDFVVDYETFLPPSWAYILFGLGFDTEAGRHSFAARPDAGRDAIATFGKVRQAQAQALAALPAHRALISQYHHH